MINNETIVMDEKLVNNFATSFFREVVYTIKNGFNKAFTCDLKLDWSPKRAINRGGIYKDGPGISIAMNVAAEYTMKGPVYFIEYPSFNTDPEIGGFWGDWRLKLKAIICHEVAHAWTAFEKTNVKPHGLEWQFKYKLLRNMFINMYIDKNLQNTMANEPIGNLDANGEVLFKENCSNFGLSPQYYGKSFLDRGEKLVITGWNPRARKNLVLITRETDNKIFSASIEFIKAKLGNLK